MNTQRIWIVVVLLLWMIRPGPSFGQDAEPRRWTHLPVGTNIVGVGLVYTNGDIFFDPVLLVEDATVEVYSVVASYMRSFGIFGKTARVDVFVPYQRARWEGLLDGVLTSVVREGLADARLRWSLNVYGAPALRGREFREYRAFNPTSTIVGTAIAVTFPLGEYMEDKLLNLGENRFTIRPQIGVVHNRGPWSFELTGSVFLFTGNNEFWNGNQREQDPLFAAQGHVVCVSRSGLWGALTGAYGHGGESTVNGTDKDDRKKNVLAAVSAGFSINRTSAVKLAYWFSDTQVDTGVDTDNFAVSYSLRF